MSDNKRRAGRPKTAPRTGPLVLEGERERMKMELELSIETAEELKEYSRWVELSSARTTADALFATVDYALRKLFRRDQLWQQERRRKSERPASPGGQIASALSSATAVGTSPRGTATNGSSAVR
jgi:hypothetical protein